MTEKAIEETVRPQHIKKEYEFQPYNFLMTDSQIIDQTIKTDLEAAMNS